MCGELIRTASSLHVPAGTVLSAQEYADARGVHLLQEKHRTSCQLLGVLTRPTTKSYVGLVPRLSFAIVKLPLKWKMHVEQTSTISYTKFMSSVGHVPAAPWMVIFLQA
jgi:hypothetical protein